MILQSPASNALLYIPHNLGTIHGDLIPSQEWLPGIGKRVLVLRDPICWLLGYYLKEESPFTFKDWFKVFAPAPQTSLCPCPDKIVRSEYFERDIREEVGIHATISLSLLANADVCSGTRSVILNKYKEDYVMGDYLSDF